MNEENFELRISQLEGRLEVQSLMLQLVLNHSPEVLKALKSLSPQGLGDFLQSRPMTDESIRAAQDRLSLILDQFENPQADS